MRPTTRVQVEEIAGQVARDVFRRRAGAVVSRAVGGALERELPKLTETTRRTVDEAVRRAVDAALTDSLGRAAGSAAAAAVADVVAPRLAEHETVLRDLASQASNEALRDATPAFTELVREEVEKAFAEVTPPVINVTLPAGRTVEIRSDTHRVLPDVLLALHAHCHVLLVGPAGTGKSMLARHAADALELPLQALSLGPTTPMSKVFGYFDAHGNYHDTPFRRAFEHGGVMLLDELDNGHPGLLGELNQALALRVCAFADGMVTAHDDFRLIATANTYGTGGDRQYVGRQTLDAATLDRFVMIDVPIDPALEQRIVLGSAPSRPDEARQLLTEVRRLREIVAEKRLPLTFSPRASIDGARLLEAGASLEQVMSWRVTRGLSDAHRTALGLGDGASGP